MSRKPDGEKTFSEKIDEFNNGDREQNPWDELPTWKFIAGGVFAMFSMLLIGGGIGSLIAGEYFIGLVLISAPFGLWFAFTETGRQAFEEMMEEFETGVQNQSKKSDSEPKRICSTCGWQNHIDNNFCNDCGSKLVAS